MSFAFSISDRVLVEHKGKRYEAQILDRKEQMMNQDIVQLYKIHYKGWNNKHDDWVEASRLNKFDDSVLVLQGSQPNSSQSVFKCPLCANENKIYKCPHSLCDCHFHVASLFRKHIHEKHNCPSDCEYCKEGADFSSSIEDGEEDKIALLDFDFPEVFKILLESDWDNIVNKKKLIEIPTENSVHKIFEKYIKNIDSPSYCNFFVIYFRVEVVESIKGLEVYFNRSIGLFLLYKAERSQYYDFRLSSPKSISSYYYGPEHLLRLLRRFLSLIFL